VQEAVRLFERAGDLEGYCSIVFMHETGKGVPKNVEEARALYQKAADRGSPLAAQRLAKLA